MFHINKYQAIQKFVINPHCRLFFNPMSSSSVKCIQYVGVVGMGLMGHGIVQTIAQGGYKVLAIDSSDDILQNGKEKIHKSLSKLISKQQHITEEMVGQKVNELMSSITFTPNLQDSKDCDLVIEAISENISIKKMFYQTLDKIVKPGAIFASNTSSLPITTLALSTNRPNLFVGLHFFNPVQLMKLVEVISTEYTSPEVYTTVTDFAKSLGKTSVACKDTPGFIVNRLLVPYLAQAMLLVDKNIATIEDIDISMKLGAGHPMGPLMLADYIGLDTCLNILKGWKVDYPEETAFFVPSCLERLVAASKLGRKSGHGFYEWNGDKAMKPNAFVL